MDRIDRHVEVPAVPYRDLAGGAGAETSSVVALRVAAARRIRQKRFSRSRISCNARMGSRHIRAHCKVDDRSAALLESAIDRLGLSARAYGRVLKISRTIADLAGAADIGTDHVAEAIGYRSLDRGGQRL